MQADSAVTGAALRPDDPRAVQIGAPVRLLAVDDTPPLEEPNKSQGNELLLW